MSTVYNQVLGSDPHFALLSGKSFLQFTSTRGLGRRLLVRTEQLSRFAWVPSESYFTFRGRLQYREKREGHVCSTEWAGTHFQWQSGTANVQRLFPLETLFRGLDSLVENVDVLLNGESIRLTTTSLYHREAEEIKSSMVACNSWVDGVESFDLKGSLAATNETTDGRGWESTRPLENPYFDRRYAWFDGQKRTRSKFAMLGTRKVEGDGSFECTWQPKHPLFTFSQGDATRMQCLRPTFEITFHSNPVFGA